MATVLARGDDDNDSIKSFLGEKNEGWRSILDGFIFVYQYHCSFSGSI